MELPRPTWYFHRIRLEMARTTEKRRRERTRSRGHYQLRIHFRHDKDSNAPMSFVERDEKQEHIAPECNMHITTITVSTYG